MQSFIHQAYPARIIFGDGVTQSLPEELERLGIKHPFLITSPAQGRSSLDQVFALMANRNAVHFSEAAMHTPITVTLKALDLLTTNRCDGLVAMGGGSTIGLSKALALRTQLPQIAIPTTYAGSEVTPILGETDNGIKKTQRSTLVQPQVVIYDVRNTLSLPVTLSASSGLNALAHAAEAMYAPDSNPLIATLAEAGIRSMLHGVEGIQHNANAYEARWQALYGAWLCGTCLGSVSMGLHHKLCHALGGTFGLPHAETHSIVLPYVLAYNANAAPRAIERIGQALGKNSPSWIVLHHLLRTLSLPTSLQALGMPETGIEPVIQGIMHDSYHNPRPLERQPLRQLLTKAFRGDEPITD